MSAKQTSPCLGYSNFYIGSYATWQDLDITKAILL